MQGFRAVNTHSQILSLSVLLLVFAQIAGCASQSTLRHGDRTYQRTSLDGPGDLSLLSSGRSETPRNLPKSRGGNRPTYEVFGQTYHVMDSARGYREQGGASWYGSKFHGRKTSNGETYSMYDMTAAHKSLPLPTFVRVRNLENEKTIIVKVNDRGPFHPGRIIDLSYAAAAQIGMLDKGTAMVEVTAISEHVAENAVERAPAPATTATAENTVNANATVHVTSNAETVPADARIVQVGAFSQINNAQSMRDKVDDAMQVGAAYIVEPGQSQYYRVRFRVAASTPLHDIFDQLERFGINNYRVIE